MTISSKAFTESLPKKRMAAGCLFFNEQGDILMVKPTYKFGWELPGGGVEHNESPKRCCQREIQEEIGMKRRVGNLLVVDYTSDTEEKTESLQFLFDGGTLTAAEVESIQLGFDELSEFRFFSIEALPTEMTPALRNRLLAAWQQKMQGTGIYLENQLMV